MRVSSDNYLTFINELSDLIDGAEEAGFDASGILSLQEARAFFLSDLAELFPGQTDNGI